jgi:hypothetical protein
MKGRNLLFYAQKFGFEIAKLTAGQSTDCWNASACKDIKVNSGSLIASAKVQE